MTFPGMANLGSGGGGGKKMWRSGEPASGEDDRRNTVPVAKGSIPAFQSTTALNLHKAAKPTSLLMLDHAPANDVVGDTRGH